MAGRAQRGAGNPLLRNLAFENVLQLIRADF